MPFGAWNFEFGCNTIADPNRLQAYIQSARTCPPSSTMVDAICPDPMVLSGLAINCDCPALQYEATDTLQQAPVLIPAYVSPKADFAPWYRAAVPESAQFLGIMLEKVEDLQAAPTSRGSNARGSNYGGSTLNRLKKTGRKVKFTLLLFGCSDCALDYGFRWLTDSLLYSCDDSGCGGLCDATVRTCCPTVSTPPTYDEWDTGRWTLKNSAVVDGPKYTYPQPMENATCNMRRVEFTLQSEDPYAYKCPVPCVTDQKIHMDLPPCPIEDWLCKDDANKPCCHIDNTSSLGEDGFTVTINAKEDLKNVVISMTPDKFGYVCGNVPPPVGFVAPAPCDTINIAFIPANTVFVYDTVHQEISITFPGGQKFDGTPYLAVIGSGVAPSFPVIRCGAMCICVTSDRCGYLGGPSTVSISSTHRELAI